MKKLSVLFFTLLASSSAFCEIVKTYDSGKNCYLYQVANQNDQGSVAADGELVSDESLYGFGLKDMEVDFKNNVVRVNVIKSIVFGFNKPLMNEKSVISPKNDQFNFLINQLNRTIMLFEKVCITKDNQVIYATFFKNDQALNEKDAQ